jgi:hypothetical protein
VVQGRHHCASTTSLDGCFRRGPRRVVRDDAWATVSQFKESFNQDSQLIYQGWIPAQARYVWEGGSAEFEYVRL